MDRRKRVALAVAGLALVGVGAVAGLAISRREAGEFRAMAVSPPYPAVDFVLTDHRGQPFRLSSLRGRAVLIFFGYTFCPDVCPATMLQYKAVRQALGRDAERVAFLFVTVDPERDTPERLRAYLELVDEAIVGLTGSPEAVQEVAASYGVLAEKVPVETPGTGYLVNHTALTYLVDPSGLLRAALPPGSRTEDMVHDVRLALRQRAGPPAGDLARASDAAGTSASEGGGYRGSVSVQQAWARPAPGAGFTSAIYMTLINGGDQPDALVAVRTDAAAAVEIHETHVDHDVMRMGRAERVEVPARGRVELRPGGLHVMLVGLTRRLQVGDRLRVVLVFERGGPLEVEVPVLEGDG